MDWDAFFVGLVFGAIPGMVFLVVVYTSILVEKIGDYLGK